VSVISNQSVYVGLDLDPKAEITPVGLLKLERNGAFESGEYAYGKRYLDLPSAFALNPDHLALKDTPIVISERRLRDGGALPITFRDALPDSWGRRVLEAQYERTLGEVDTLLLSNADRIGAMVFSETLPFKKIPPEVELISIEKMAQATRKLELSMEIPLEFRRLLQRGGTLGGARPKASIVHEGRRMIAKFPAQGDDHDAPLLEMSTLTLASRCGIEVSPAKLEKIYRGHALVLLRFDRTGLVGQERKIHYLSTSALFNIPYESHDGSYLEFAQILRRISKNPTHDLEQLFRRMVFNLIIDNTDDHVKNHGVLYLDSGQYRLSPAFDVVMQLTNLGYQELAISPKNHDSKISLAISVAPHFGINEQLAQRIIQIILATVNDELIEIINHFGGDKRLIERVKLCLKRQQEIIFDQ
jgi:serine/threonine-protein kinase HipA